jgi:hypothetical protein
LARKLHGRRRVVLVAFAAAIVLAAPVGVATAANAGTTSWGTGVYKPAPAPLTVRATPSRRTVHAGKTAKYRICVQATTGAQDVGLSLGTDGQPNHINFHFTPNPTQGTATLVIQTSADTRPGKYTLTIFADTPTAHVTTTVKLVVVG